MRKFVKQVEETALGVKVVKGVKPDQQLVKVVNDQLIELMGGEQQDLVQPAKGPQVKKRHLMPFDIQWHEDGINTEADLTNMRVDARWCRSHVA